MAGRIPQSFIDDLLNRVDIVEVIDSRVPLKKAGRDYVACCPFHNEKTPSFTVSQTKQFYHCFGCGAHGSAIGFLMDYDHLEFPDAIEELARAIGLDVPHEKAHNERKAQDEPDHLAILEAADQHFRRWLREHPDAQRAVAYLKGRGLSGDIAKRFGVGYAPPGWETLAAQFKSDPARLRVAIELGLLILRDNGTAYDRFRDRVMFPIRDRRGRVIGFGGRVLGDEKPKYMNSPESPLFHKGRELYGLFEARQVERHLTQLIVVEGYMDVVALVQHGIANTVATLGTAATAEHLERLYRIVPEVVFCFDGDEAGRKAAWRALENALPVMREGREARFLFLPEGEDPDSLVRKEGAENFRKRIVESIPLSAYFYEELGRQVDMNSIDGKARLADLARPLLKKLPDSLFRDMMSDRLADLTHMSGALIQERIFGKTAAGPDDGGRPARPRPASAPRSPVRTAIGLLLREPRLAALVQLPASWQRLDLPGVALLTELLELLHGHPNYQLGQVLEHWRGRPEEKHLARLATETPDEADIDYAYELRGVIDILEQRYAGMRLEQLRQQPIGNLSDAEKEELAQLVGTRRATRPDNLN